MIKDTLRREFTRRATTAVVTAAAAAAAAAAGDTAVRCCRVHVCSYTRGLTYVRLAAYRPRRTRPQNGVTEVGELLVSEKEEEKPFKQQGESTGGLDQTGAGQGESRVERKAWPSPTQSA